MRSVLVLFTVLATLVAGLGLPAPAAATKAAAKVAIIVGPVGEELTPVYISLADAAATAAEQRGATVARAYSPDADEKSVRKAVRGANIVIYFGHGVGSPNPYSDTPSPLTTNGWGLNGPNRRGDHSDSFADGALAYYGEAWIAQHAKPAPNWVMIYSNACYAPGAGEGQHPQATESEAAGRVSAYSRGPLADLGASAYFATDFFEGAAHLVGALLDEPNRPYRDIFMSEPRFEPDALVTFAHDSIDGAETWLHRSPYFEGKVDYWYAFAGDPDASLGGRPTALGGRAAEPLAQPECRALLALLADRGYEVSLETSGALDIGNIDARVSVVMDLKTPASKEEHRNRYENVALLKRNDQVKFVICDRADYEWSRARVAIRGRSIARCFRQAHCAPAAAGARSLHSIRKQTEAGPGGPGRADPTASFRHGRSCEVR